MAGTGAKLANFNLDTLGSNLSGMALRGVVTAGVNNAINGGSFGTAFKNSVVSDLAAVGANAVGQTDWDAASRAVAHAGVGCAAAAGQGKDCAAGAIGGATASLLNPVVDNAIGGEDGSGWGSNLSDAQVRQSVTLQATSMLASGAVASAFKRDAVTAANAAQNETLNNYLTKNQIQDKQAALKKAATDEQRLKIQQHYEALDKQQQAAAADCLLGGNCASVLDTQTLKGVLADLNASCAPPRMCSADAQASIRQLNELYAKADSIDKVYPVEEILLGNKLLNTAIKAVPAVWARLTGAVDGTAAAGVKESALAADTSGTFSNRFSGVQAASDYLKAEGVSRNFRVQILQSFESDSIVLRQAGSSEFGIRYYDNVKAFENGRYLFETFPASRESLAVKAASYGKDSWNDMTSFRQWQIRPGATFIEGRAASQGLGYSGGQIQKYILNPNKDYISP